MSVLERRIHDCKDTSPYLQHAKNYTSQGGEDGVLEVILQKLFTTEAIDRDRALFCVDVGAWDGKHLSNTFELVHESGWGGLLIEADSDRCSDMAHLYASRPDVICLNQYVDITGENSLLDTLHRLGVREDFEFLSIDVDGADYHLWNSLRGQFHPAIVCIEFNPTIQNNVYFIQEADIHIQQGSSLLALKELGVSLGYTIVVTTLFNAIFVRNDIASQLQPFSTALDDLHASTMITNMFQTYDGELKFVGPRKLMWHKLSFNPEKMQPLTKKQRRFLCRPGATPGLGEGFHSKTDRQSDTAKMEATLIRIIEITNSLCSGPSISSVSSAEIDELWAKCFIILKHCADFIPLLHCQSLVIEVLHIVIGSLDLLRQHKTDSRLIANMYEAVYIRVALLYECRGKFWLGGKENYGAEDALKWLQLSYYTLSDAVGFRCDFAESLCSANCPFFILKESFDKFAATANAWKIETEGAYSATKIDFKEDLDKAICQSCVGSYMKSLASEISRISLQRLRDNDRLRDSAVETLYWAQLGSNETESSL